jgi:DNA polymerase-3 subunit delta
LPEFATLILVAEAEDSAERARRAPFDEPLMAAMKSHGLVRQFALLKPEEMVQLAVREAASCEKRLPTSVAALLVERTGTDSLRLINEVRKLASYVGDRAGITAQDVDLMLAPPLDNNVWHLLEAAFSGQGNRALGLLRQLIESGTSVHQILPLLARTLRNLAQAKLLDEHGIPAAAERESLSTELLAALPPDGGIYVGSNAWQRGRLWNQAKRFDWSQIHRAIDRLALVEAGLKGWERGIEDEHLALEVFLLELLGSRPVRSSR